MASCGAAETNLSRCTSSLPTSIQRIGDRQASSWPIGLNPRNPSAAIMSKPIRSAFSVEGEGAPLILIHGIGASRHSWDGIVDRLKSKYRCITYDLRGHGKSPLPPPPYGLDDLVGDLEALRAELGLAKVHIAGHSLGGMIAP